MLCIRSLKAEFAELDIKFREHDMIGIWKPEMRCWNTNLSFLQLASARGQTDFQFWSMGTTPIKTWFQPTNQTNWNHIENDKWQTISLHV